MNFILEDSIIFGTILLSLFFISGGTLFWMIKLSRAKKESEVAKKQIELIFSKILIPFLITSKKRREIVFANENALKQYEITEDKLLGGSIDMFYTDENQRYKILEVMKKYGVVKNLEMRYKTYKGNYFDALLSLIDIIYKGEECYLGIITDITEQRQREEQIKDLHRKVTDSIKYASLIQHSLIPNNNIFEKYVDDYFVLWKPRDIVGGDIYLLEELRNDDEVLIMLIDCAGHGVPGAFVAMLVKAIERQIVGEILNSNVDVSPAKILTFFNKNMKTILRQNSDNFISNAGSNAGFDGGILYYNKKDKIIKYAGAKVPLYLIKNGKLKVIKADRHSIGYKRSKANFEFKDNIIKIDSDIRLYITTDGYLDQSGEDRLPFGKKRFQELIIESNMESFEEQKIILLDKFLEYKGKNRVNDDVTVIGMKFIQEDIN